MAAMKSLYYRVFNRGQPKVLNLGLFNILDGPMLLRLHSSHRNSRWVPTHDLKGHSLQNSLCDIKSEDTACDDANRRRPSIRLPTNSKCSAQRSVRGL